MVQLWTQLSPWLVLKGLSGVKRAILSCPMVDTYILSKQWGKDLSRMGYMKCRSSTKVKIAVLDFQRSEGTVPPQYQSDYQSGWNFVWPGHKLGSSQCLLCLHQFMNDGEGGVRKDWNCCSGWRKADNSCLCGLLSGDFVPSQLIHMYKGANEPCHPGVNFPSDWHTYCMIHTASTTWCNESTMKAYNKKILFSYQWQQ